MYVCMNVCMYVCLFVCLFVHMYTCVSILCVHELNLYSASLKAW